MALRSLVQLRGFFELVPAGSKSIRPSDLQNLTPPSYEWQGVLTSGANTIAVPTNAYGAIIIFDPTSTVAKTVVGVDTDTGIPVAPDAWSCLSFPSTPPTNLLITCGAADTGKTTGIVFF